MKIIFVVGLIILGAFLLITIVTYWTYTNVDKSLKDWDIIKALIDGELKKELMKIHNLTEEEYIQCTVGIWVISCIEENDLKKLLKLKENLYNEIKVTKDIIFLIKMDQKKMRLLFLCKDKDVLEYWGTKYMTTLINLLKQEPKDNTLDEIEKVVAFDFNDEYENGESVLQKKTKDGNLTIVENAIKRVPKAFKQRLRTYSS